MRSRAARTASLITGGLAVLVGGVWIGQGSGLIKGQLHDRKPDLARYRAAVFRGRTATDLPCVAASSERQRLTVGARHSRAAAARPSGFRQDR
jgi:hypothetical protein